VRKTGCLQNTSVKVDFSRFHVSINFHHFRELVVLGGAISIERVVRQPNLS
jgi:hypothetical protein